MDSAPWTSLEVAKLVVGLLTPLAVAALGWFISRRIKQLEHAQWTSQKMIEKRLAFYDEVAPKLNALLCFFNWLGYWKDVSPADAVRLKRELDKAMHVYRHLFDAEVFDAYQALIGLLFKPYNGPGHDAKLITTIASLDGSRKEHGRYAWNSAWDDLQSGLFLDPALGPPAGKQAVRSAYERVMAALTASLASPVKPAKSSYSS